MGAMESGILVIALVVVLVLIVLAVFLRVLPHWVVDQRAGVRRAYFHRYAGRYARAAHSASAVGVSAD